MCWQRSDTLQVGVVGMDNLAVAVAVVQGLGALVLALFGWYGQRSVSRLDDYGNRDQQVRVC